MPPGLQLNHLTERDFITMLTFTLETITPSEAARILTEHDKLVKSGEIINRPRMPATWRKYQADLSNGRWYAETAEPLKFETLDQHLQGKNLIDGQNRLEACVRAGVNLEVYVARNVARRAFSYIDGGVPRNLATKLTIRGEELTPQQTTWLAAALKHLCRWDEANVKITNSPVTDQACIYLLESDPAIRKSLAKAQAVWEQRLIGVGAATFLHRIFSRQRRHGEWFAMCGGEVVGLVEDLTRRPLTNEELWT